MFVLQQKYIFLLQIMFRSLFTVHRSPSTVHRSPFAVHRSPSFVHHHSLIMIPFIILGAGIGGLTTAIALQKAGLECRVYEVAPQFLPLGAGITLAGNAMKAYDYLGIQQQVIDAGYTVQGAAIQTQYGKELAVFYNTTLAQKYGYPLVTIHRADLHQALLNEVENASETIVLGKKAISFEENTTEVRVQFEDNTTATGQFLIAADGIKSAIRRQLYPQHKIRYAGYTCWRGVCQFPHHLFDAQKMTESWGWGERFGVVPLKGERVYWFMVKNAPYRDPLMSAFDREKMLNVFGHWHQPIPALIEATPETDIIWNDILDISPLKQWGKGRVTLLGDAAHATTPNMGQGACQAIEDAVYLGNVLKKHGASQKSLRLYEQGRKKRTAEVIKRSWRLGKIAHLENPILTFLRDKLVQWTPQSVSNQQISWIYDVSYEL